ncbi:MAG TPA: glycosyltransferase family 4 protein [Candidatus Baltobacteraceae bacterium]|nr:glycosyltransferase family 4 protein [Candidatus Baltobacteraceae bacterium]
MRVLIWSDSYIPLLGGGELFTLRTKQALDAAGFDTHLATVKNNRIRAACDVTTIPILRIKGVPLASPYSLQSLIARFQPHGALLIGPSINNVIVAALLGDRPIVTHYLGDLGWNSIAGRILWPAYFRWYLPRSRYVLTISDRVRESLIAQGVPASRVSSTKVGSDVPMVPDLELERENKIVFIGGLGRSHEYKRPDLLLRALPILSDKDVSVALIGGGDAGWLRALVQELSIEHRVRFLGVVDDEERARQIRSARVLVLPSPTSQEGFGIVVLEAMRLGTPAVVGALAGASELVAATGFGETWRGTNEADLARAIDLVLSMPHKSLQLAFEKFVAISNDYTWESVAARTVAVTSAAFA